MAKPIFFFCLPLSLSIELHPIWPTFLMWASRDLLNIIEALSNEKRKQITNTETEILKKYRPRSHEQGKIS